MGAHFRLAIFPESSWTDIEHGLQVSRVGSQGIYALDAGAALAYDRVDWTAPRALIVSNEAHGLTSEAAEFTRERGGSRLTIPMSGGTESLNASTAAAVVMFEAARQRRAVSISDVKAQATGTKEQHPGG
jgi:TrmH family RNA methyltransferase